MPRKPIRRIETIFSEQAVEGKTRLTQQDIPQDEPVVEERTPDRALPSQEQQKSDDVQAQAEAAYSLITNRSYDEAFALLVEAKRRSSTNPKVAYLLAWIYAKRNQFAKAAETVEELSLDPSDTFNLLKRSGYASYYRQYYRSAASKLAEAVEQAPDDAPALSTLGAVYLQLGRYQEAAVISRKAASLSTNAVSAGSLFYVARSEERLKNYEEAERYYEAAAEADPTDATIAAGLIRVKFRRGKLRKAVAQFVASVHSVKAARIQR